MRAAIVTCVILAIAATTGLAATIPITVQNSSGVVLEAEPITTGVPFPEGALASGDSVRLLDAAGTELPLQVTVTGEYPDDSARWLLLDFQADLPPEGRTLTLEFGEGAQVPQLLFQDAYPPEVCEAFMAAR